jgi:hypothetical protein
MAAASRGGSPAFSQPDHFNVGQAKETLVELLLPRLQRGVKLLVAREERETVRALAQHRIVDDADRELIELDHLDVGHDGHLGLVGAALEPRERAQLRQPIEHRRAIGRARGELAGGIACRSDRIKGFVAERRRRLPGRRPRAVLLAKLAGRRVLDGDRVALGANLKKSFDPRGFLRGQRGTRCWMYER